MKRALTVAAASVLLVAGCGGDVNGGVVTAEPGDDTAGTTTELTVTVKAGRGKGTQTYTLTCDPPGGDHPDAAAACGLLDRVDDPFAPVPANAMCTEIYGGPQTARVTGTLRGEQVDATFKRTNGCEIARWDKHRALLVEAGGVED